MKISAPYASWQAMASHILCLKGSVRLCDGLEGLQGHSNGPELSALPWPKLRGVQVITSLYISYR